MKKKTFTFTGAEVLEIREALLSNIPAEDETRKNLIPLFKSIFEKISPVKAKKAFTFTERELLVLRRVILSRVSNIRDSLLFHDGPYISNQMDSLEILDTVFDKIAPIPKECDD